MLFSFAEPTGRRNRTINMSSKGMRIQLAAAAAAAAMYECVRFFKPALLPRHHPCRCW